MRASGVLSPSGNNHAESAESSVIVDDAGGGGKGGVPAAAASTVGGLPAAPSKSAAVQAYVCARFLPYDDIRRITLVNDSNTAGCDLVYGGERLRPHVNASGKLQHQFLNSGMLDSLAHTHSSTASSFMSELQRTLAQTLAYDGAGATTLSIGDDDAPENVLWNNLFRKWPLELAASGYAEWWLRHSKCVADATPLFNMIIGELAEEERRRRLGDGFTEDDETSPGVVHGTLGMILSICSDPPQSLKNFFGTVECYQQLFYRACFLGTYPCRGMRAKRKDARELIRCLSLAAVAAQRVAGELSVVRHDLLCFMGRVRREWESLVETRADEEALRVDFEWVQSLMAFACD
ncbi:hypothetical protein DQ04_12141010 [Trypanosoma grayi]|uniref:hypothetical protein n=1 Tax=Trypanosoma grayi TaxID=71804 RepID=UPI0004F49186|nr:hypothetical protein DQ04_12141010 [Trypanosoma grayi]KEG06804.1 hypothetical protein DQ04_12141010 [Trypanosoma grayi]